MGIWFSISAYRVQGDQFVAIFENITTAKQTEKRLDEQAALLDIATDAILVYDMERRIRYWNKGAQDTYGWTAREAVGKSADELLFAPEYVDEHSEAYVAVLAKGKWSGLFHKKDKGGHSLTAEVRWTLVRDREGNPTEIFPVGTDVTEKRKIESQLLRCTLGESARSPEGWRTT